MSTTLDFSPLFRSSIGFERLLNAIEANRAEDSDNWPPYDIIKASKDEYRIAMAVAGFSQNDLTVAQEQNLLIVSGQKADSNRGDYLHHGIAARPFQRRFELADYVKVTQAELENGLLTIAMKREIPEEKKPRRIAIASGVEASDTKGGRDEAAERAA
ncbi:Hsp20 family protein (plasmid) [Bosea sp. F3-2]|uniref:Hsp20 family protein n=1 Tax=Bosea sp. F3-2 TaxID=2599640 RepID=UPI0011F05A6D|nr:Hsp20 family protein [Bosea sp. F3-2]QEL27098.1 Hsp20 family protein [Bosea sp. F3-2]